MPGTSNHNNYAVYWYLELSGACVGRLHSAEFPTQTSLAIETGGNMTKPFFNWISTSLKGGSVQDCTVITVDSSGNTLYRDQCKGRVSQVEMPACDAASRNASYIRVTITTHQVNAKSSSTGKYNQAAPVPKPFLSNDFKFSINDLQGGQYVMSATGLCLGRSVPVLTTELVESRAGAIRSWQQSGNQPKGGSLEYLGPDLRPILTVELQSLRVSNITPAYPTNPNQKVFVSLQASAASLKC